MFILLNRVLHSMIWLLNKNKLIETEKQRDKERERERDRKSD